MFSDMILENSNTDSSKYTPFCVNGDITRRLVSKYHKLIDLKGSKIDFNPSLSFINCNNIHWIDGKDLFEVMEPMLTNLKFDCSITKFGVFKDIDNKNILYLKIELPQYVKELRHKLFKRIKYVGANTEADKTNIPHIRIASFTDKVPSCPKFEPETISITKLKYIFDGNVKMEQYF